MRCGSGITACMGFVLARDILSATDGRIPWTSVREHCGRCVEVVAMQPDHGRGYLAGLPEFPDEFPADCCMKDTPRG